jgi:hypothetical protein
MIVDKRTGKRVSELSGPSAGASARLSNSLPDLQPGGDGVWAWLGWWWDHRSLHWLPSWRNDVLRATVIEGAGYWRVTSGRAYGTGDTFGQAWRAMCARERAYADALWSRLCPTFAADMRARTGAVQRWTAARFPSSPALP